MRLIEKQRLDRNECYQAFLRFVDAGIMPQMAAEKAIFVQAIFDHKYSAQKQSESNDEIKPDFEPKAKHGRFVCDDCSVYFEENGGDRFLIASFDIQAQAMKAVLTYNAFLLN